MAEESKLVARRQIRVVWGQQGIQKLEGRGKKSRKLSNEKELGSRDETEKGKKQWQSHLATERKRIPHIGSIQTLLLILKL